MVEITEKEVLAILEQTKTIIENENLLQIEDSEDFEDYVVKK